MSKLKAPWKNLVQDRTFRDKRRLIDQVSADSSLNGKCLS